MYPVHIIAAVNKTADAAAVQGATARSHAAVQDSLSARETARLDRSHEQVSAVEAEDRLELSADGEGKGGGGGSAGDTGDEEEATEERPALPPVEHIDFLA